MMKNIHALLLIISAMLSCLQVTSGAAICLLMIQRHDILRLIKAFCAMCARARACCARCRRGISYITMLVNVRRLFALLNAVRRKASGCISR